jgi:hypothetical protein
MMKAMMVPARDVRKGNVLVMRMGISTGRGSKVCEHAVPDGGGHRALCGADHLHLHGPWRPDWVSCKSCLRLLTKGA